MRAVPQGAALSVSRDQDLCAEIDRIIDELRLEWDMEDREPFRIEPADIKIWQRRTRLDGSTLLDRMGMTLAQQFHDGKLEFKFCDDVVNDLWHYLLAATDLHESWPGTFNEVFDAFEAGEIRNQATYDPVEFYTRPLIAKLLGMMN